MEFKVTKKAMRPASDKQQCFYCQQAIGDNHKDTCVLINQKIRIQVTTELEVSVPHHWDEGTVSFHFNESSWCANNLINIIEENGCICGVTDIKPISLSKEPFLEE